MAPSLQGGTFILYSTNKIRGTESFINLSKVTQQAMEPELDVSNSPSQPMPLNTKTLKFSLNTSIL